ncbi:MAG: hypothetical protein U5K33_08375 [Halofilum sp. (in: g-proteobacteria)]|nr:hypothetical protein [Halofilum sp. (in: g-proteobacteria)]
MFPRQDGSREFNLDPAATRAPGDPSVRDADRMTFLQALMAARHCFYLSYTGRNVADGEALQPSPVVGEFLDFLHGHHFAGQSRDDFRAAVVTEQPMHPFSPRYFEPDTTRLFTFVDDWRRAAEAQRGERAAPRPLIDGTAAGRRRTRPSRSSSAELQRFFRHPAQWFFRERLRLAARPRTTSASTTRSRAALDGLGSARAA